MPDERQILEKMSKPEAEIELTSSHYDVHIDNNVQFGVQIPHHKNMSHDKCKRK